MTTELSTEVQSVIDKIKTKSNLVKWTAGIGGTIFIGFTVWAVLSAVLGLAALGLTLGASAVAGVTFINWWPRFIDRQRTRKIERVIEDARKSPIPTMWDEHAMDIKEADAFENSVVEYSTEIENCVSKRKELAPHLTEEDLAEFDAEIKDMKHDLELQEQDLAEVRDAIDKQEKAIKRFSALWDLAQARIKANEKNQNARREDIISKLRKEAAIDSVTNAMNSSKAKLRARINSRRKAGSTPALENKPSDAIDVSATIVRTQDSVSERINAR